MAKKKVKPKIKINTVVFHKEEQKAFIIDNVGVYPKGPLYTMREVGNDGEYKRYYEQKLLTTCEKVKNDKAIKILYGKKK